MTILRYLMVYLLGIASTVGWALLDPHSPLYAHFDKRYQNLQKLWDGNEVYITWGVPGGTQEELLREHLFVFPIILDACHLTPREIRRGTLAPLRIVLGKRFMDWDLLRDVLLEARTPLVLDFFSDTQGSVDEVTDDRLRYLLEGTDKCWCLILPNATRISKEGLEFLAKKASLE